MTDVNDPVATPLVVVISGPSGVGKDVLIEGMAGRGLDYHFTVTATTRNPRPGEYDGINHHFLSTDEFQRAIADDELLEWARVYGNYYGVPKQQVRDALAQGKHVIHPRRSSRGIENQRVGPRCVDDLYSPTEHGRVAAAHRATRREQRL